MPRSLAVLLLLTLPAVPAAAQTFETAGARALGMGGAFVGVADDATAIWWNPAGLATGGFFGLSVEHHRFEQDRRGFGVPGPSQRSSFFLGAGSLPIGLSYVRTRESYVTPGPADEPLTRDLVTHQAGLTVLQSLSDTIVVSGTLKYVRGVAATGLQGTEPDGQGGNAFDADLAMMAVAGDLKVGVTVKNLTSPSFDAPDGTRLQLPWRARAGASYLAMPNLTMAVDLDLWTRNSGIDRQRMLAVGGEYRLARAALRAGARFDTVGNVNPLGTVGGSYAVRNGVWVDVWAAAGPREAERGWGLAGRVVY
jgi:hypothetical protein